MWKIWPGTGSTLSVRAVSSCWVAGRTLSLRVSFCVQLAASPNAPEGLPTHSQNPQDPTEKESQVCWDHPKGPTWQQASDINSDLLFSENIYIICYIYSRMIYIYSRLGGDRSLRVSSFKTINILNPRMEFLFFLLFPSYNQLKTQMAFCKGTLGGVFQNAIPCEQIA